jgi:hypothetical protein
MSEDTKEEAAGAKEEPIAQATLLQIIQRNTFIQPCLENYGVMVLGEAIRRSPEINKPELFEDVEFGADQNKDWEDYSIRTQSVWSGSITKLLPAFESVVEAAIPKIIQVIEDTNCVIGTLRMRVSDSNPINDVDHITLSLVWIVKEENSDND